MFIEKYILWFALVCSTQVEPTEREHKIAKNGRKLSKVERNRGTGRLQPKTGENGF